MRLNDALSGVSRLGLDTAPLIYFIERDSARLPLVREVIRRATAGSLLLIPSTLIVAEVLTRPRRLGAVQVEAAYLRYLRHGRNLLPVPVSFDIADKAASLRARYGLRTPDALGAATALECGCQAFLTNDKHLRRVTELSVLVLDDLVL